MQPLQMRIIESARRMSALLGADLRLEDVFTGLCDLLASQVEATEVEVVVRDGRRTWVCLLHDGDASTRTTVSSIGELGDAADVMQAGTMQVLEDPARFAVPLRVDDELVGAINLTSGSLPHYSDDDLVLLQSLAPYTAVAVRQRLLHAELERERFRAQHDPLTRLANRALFSDRLHHALARTLRTFGTLAVLYMDLDHFKPVNDEWGHEAGDAVLRTVARRIIRAVRGSDTVARLGGDEFGVILEDLADDTAVAAVVEKIQTSLRKPIRWNRHTLDVDVSIGWSIAPRDGTDGATLLQRADAFMYDVKRARRLTNR